MGNVGSEARFLISPYCLSEGRKQYFHAPSDRQKHNKPIALVEETTAQLRNDCEGRYVLTANGGKREVSIRHEVFPQPLVGFNENNDVCFVERGHGRMWSDCRWTMVLVAEREVVSAASERSWESITTPSLAYQNAKGKQFLCCFLANKAGHIMCYGEDGVVRIAQWPVGDSEDIIQRQLELTAKVLFELHTIGCDLSAAEVAIICTAPFTVGLSALTLMNSPALVTPLTILQEGTAENLVEDGIISFILLAEMISFHVRNGR